MTQDTQDVHPVQVGNDVYTEYNLTTKAHVCRNGWAGVFDAIKAAVSRGPRLTLQQDLKISVMVKTLPAGGVGVYRVTAVLVEGEPEEVGEAVNG